jgi:MFS family permease
VARISQNFFRYLETRQRLRGSLSKQSRRGLDWTNFFLADIQTGFGAFVAFYLAELGWEKQQVGLVLSAGTIAGLIAHIPGGALVDVVPWKRALAALGITMIAVSALIYALVPTFTMVFIAEILHGVTGGIVTPAIAAISLGLVGRGAMSVRTGRNYRFDAAGNALTAGAMGVAGQYLAKSAIFFGAAALCVPALIALGFIRADEIDYSRARNAGVGKNAVKFTPLFDLGKNLKLYLFAACIFLFQFADCFGAARRQPGIGAQSESTGFASDGGFDHRAPVDRCIALAMDWLSFGKIRPQTTFADRVRRRNRPSIAVCALFGISDAYCRTDPWWHQCGDCDGFDCARRHGSDNRHGPLQSGARICRHGHRHCGVVQHRRDRLHFRPAWSLARFSDFGRSSDRGYRFAMDWDARNQARQIP